MSEEFNPKTPDREGVRYVALVPPLPTYHPSTIFSHPIPPSLHTIPPHLTSPSSYYSYGATASPAPWSAFRHSHRIVATAEGPNDGLVSVASSRWGGYKGTLVDVSHLDLINWTNRLRWLVWQMMGNPRK